MHARVTLETPTGKKTVIEYDNMVDALREIKHYEQLRIATNQMRNNKCYNHHCDNLLHPASIFRFRSRPLQETVAAAISAAIFFITIVTAGTTFIITAVVLKISKQVRSKILKGKKKKKKRGFLTGDS